MAFVNGEKIYPIELEVDMWPVIDGLKCSIGKLDAIDRKPIELLAKITADHDKNSECMRETDEKLSLAERLDELEESADILNKRLSMVGDLTAVLRRLPDADIKDVAEETIKQNTEYAAVTGRYLTAACVDVSEKLFAVEELLLDMAYEKLTAKA